MSKPIVYAFDVDETLWISGGPVTAQSLIELRNAGSIIGLCGNFAAVTRNCVDWFNLFSFLGSMGMTKAEFLVQLKTHVPCSEVVMVGNIKGVSGSSDDQGESLKAGVRFIKESDFAAGAR